MKGTIIGKWRNSRSSEQNSLFQMSRVYTYIIVTFIIKVSMIEVSLPHATKLRQGNVFARVCDSVHRGSLSRGGSLLGRPPGQRPPYGNDRAVCILLECILVFISFLSEFW